MSLPRSRLRGLALVVLLLVLVAVVSGLTGRTGWSTAALAVLVGTVCLLLLDIRHRQQVSARTQRRLEEAVATATGKVVGLRSMVEADAAALTELEQRIRDESEEAAGRHTETTRRLAHLDYEPVNEVQALLQLLPKVPAGAPPLPGVGGWALTASSLLGIWDVVERERPGVIVECGSGTSTLWLSYVARAVGGVRVIALDHKASYARHTQELLAKHGLDDVAEVHHAPLRPVEVDGQPFRWYDDSCLADVHGIGLLVVDGPPKSTGRHARYPAIPFLRAKLTPGAAIVMDDVGRPAEQDAMKQWSERYGVEVERSLSRDAVLLRLVGSLPTA